MISLENISFCIRIVRDPDLLLIRQGKEIILHSLRGYFLQLTETSVFLQFFKLTRNFMEMSMSKN